MKALAIASAIVFWTLVLGTAWLAYVPSSDKGEPVAILYIDPARKPTMSSSLESAPAPEPIRASGSATATNNPAELPPGVSLLIPARPNAAQ